LGVKLLLRRWRIGEEGYDAEQTDEEETLPPRLPQDFQLLSDLEEGGLEAEAKRYVLARGVSERQVRRHKIGVSLVGRFAYRVVFPIFYKRKLRGIVARDFTGQQQPKYLFNNGVKPLYNMQPQAKGVILSEGVFKALRIERAIPGYCSVALLGHNLSEHQKEFLRGCKRVVVWPDPDKAGRRGAANVCEKLLSLGVETFVLPRVTEPADELRLQDLRVEFSFVQPYNVATSVLLFSTLQSWSNRL
jgi:DNA primase